MLKKKKIKKKLVMLNLKEKKSQLRKKDTKKPEQEHSTNDNNLSGETQKAKDTISLESKQHVSHKKEEPKKEKDEKRKIFWGMDMFSEHERYLTEEVFKMPIIVYNYPKEIKSFYMRQNEDGKTVAAMDILVPKIGEIIGGSQREERLELLQKKISRNAYG